MNYAKLDAALQELLAESELDEAPRERVFVSVVIAPDASRADRERLQTILDDASSFGAAVVAGELTMDELTDVSENPAVIAIQLSRRLRPKQHRHAS